ncbi:MAG: DUF370 domain-containing protein [Ruminococcaceae bacterium]|nr:DUF370 domain-containing protein [Oscillospiraceae bacterium]
MELLDIGFGNFVSAQRVVAVVNPDSAPIKRVVQDARERGMLIDATYGRRMKVVLVTDSGHIVLSATLPKDGSGKEIISIEEASENA